MRNRIHTLMREALLVPADSLYRRLDERIDDGSLITGSTLDAEDHHDALGLPAT